MSTHSVGGGSGPVGGHRGVFGKGNKPADKLPKASKPEPTPLRDVFERVQVARDLFASAAAKPALGPVAGLELAQHGAGAVGGGNIAAAFDVEELASLGAGGGSVGGNIAAAFDVEELVGLKPGVGSVRGGNIASAFDVEELVGLKPGGGSVGGNIAAAFDVEELVVLKPVDGSVRGGNIAAAFDVEELLSLRPDPASPGVAGRLGVPAGVTRKA
jgi:hypothetical protein